MTLTGPQYHFTRTNPLPWDKEEALLSYGANPQSYYFEGLYHRTYCKVFVGQEGQPLENTEENSVPTFSIMLPSSSAGDWLCYEQPLCLWAASNMQKMSRLQTYIYIVFRPKRHFLKWHEKLVHFPFKPRNIKEKATNLTNGCIEAKKKHKSLPWLTIHIYDRLSLVCLAIWQGNTQTKGAGSTSSSVD